MFNKNINTEVFFNDYVSGTTNTSFTIHKEMTQLFICNDGSSSISLTLNFANEAKTVSFLAGEKIALPVYVGDVAKGIKIDVTATTAFRIFVLGV